MLSRVADNLYWMSRYLERVEHTARLIGVNITHMLEQRSDATACRWTRLLASLRVPVDGDEALDAYRITNLLTFDSSSGASIAYSIQAARSNARQVREQISSEMWEHLNRLYLTISSKKIDGVWQSEPYEFYQLIKDRAHMFLGVTDATMSHGEGWQFIQLGRYIERATLVADLLDVHFRLLTDTNQNGKMQFDDVDWIEWVALLKSCTSFEAYCKVYTANVRPNFIAEFLILNPESPRSIRFAVEQVQTALQAIASETSGRRTGRAERLAGRLRATLSYAHVDEIMASGIHNYLANIRSLCEQIHQAVKETYTFYPIDVALASHDASLQQQ